MNQRVKNEQYTNGYTIPEKPMNAIARRPVVIRAIGIPCKGFGMLESDNCSRIPAKTINAKAKPIAVEAAKTMDCNRLYSFCITKMATPSIAQLVDISGRKTPNA